VNGFVHVQNFGTPRADELFSFLKKTWKKFINGIEMKTFEQSLELLVQ
jgi:hypothetical protein